MDRLTLIADETHGECLRLSHGDFVFSIISGLD